MIPVDLVTGFLGAGKTSFLLRYARFLLGKGQRLGILVYDHGAVNVDLPLLKELRGENCELEMLVRSGARWRRWPPPAAGTAIGGAFAAG